MAAKTGAGMRVDRANSSTVTVLFRDWMTTQAHTHVDPLADSVGPPSPKWVPQVDLRVQSGVMLLDRLLAPPEGAKLRSDIHELCSPRSLMVEGVTQDRGGIRQFRFWVEESEASRAAVFDDGAQWSYFAGNAHYDNEKPHPMSFTESLPGPLKMLWPATLLVWGESPTHFRPVLAQHLGQRSLLVTFEHGGDPAMRQTMVVDRFSGIATKRIEYDHVSMLTNVAVLEAGTRALNSTFEPLTDWIRSTY